MKTPSNNAIENLAVLCLEDHNLTQISGGFGRKLGAAEVTRCCDDWVACARARGGDKIIVARMASVPPEPVAEGGEWYPPSDEALVRLLDSCPQPEANARTSPSEVDTGHHSEMMDGTYFAIDVFTRVWLGLARWYPPYHFDGPARPRLFCRVHCGLPHLE